MEKISILDVVKWLDGEYSGSSDIFIDDISTDTRTIHEGSLFVALEGERFDGHEFINRAFESGATCCIAHKKGDYISENVVYVEHTEYALLKLSEEYKKTFDLKTVAVTGSVGKTTTKDMIAAVLSQKYNTVKTQGNFNNRIGMPKSIFAISRDTGAAVLEMGMSDLGEIEELSLAAHPDIAVITMIGVSHLENLKTRENILKAKLEVVAGMKAGSVLIINKDNDLLSGVQSAGECRIVTFAIDALADYKAENIVENGFETSFTVMFNQLKQECIIPTVGKHSVLDAVSAFAVGIEAGLTPQECAAGLLDYSPSGMRQRIVDRNGIVTIEDCYNASPDSMKASLGVLANLKCDGKKVAVLGDMLELGENSERFHREIGEFVLDKGIDLLLTYGDAAKEYAVGAGPTVRSLCFTDHKEVADMLKHELRVGDAVLFKASRGMKLEDIIEATFKE